MVSGTVGRSGAGAVARFDAVTGAGTGESPPGAGGVWRDVPREALGDLTRRLFESGAALFQLPYWNEPLTHLHLRPRHLVHRVGGVDRAYACVLTLGPPGARLGLVQRGPVALDDGPVDGATVASLVAWARRRGYVFLRFTHHDARVLDAARLQPGAREEDAFPLYREPDEELVVDQRGSDAEVCARFQPIGRREILHAERAGYELSRSDAPERLAEVWPMFERLGQRKSFSFRPLASYLELMRLARPHGAVSVYVARLDGRPIQALFIVRSRDTAHFISGALDVEALGDAPSPSAWLHWRAMRELAAEGAWRYDLGSRSGRVYAFKRKFRPAEARFPPPVTVVLNRPVYAVWSYVARALTGEGRRRVKALVARVDRSRPTAGGG